MTTLELYNMALGLIGHDQVIIALPSTSTEARRCNTFYAAARRAVFSFYDWQWLISKASVTTATTFNSDGVTFVHAKPTGMLRLVDVRDAAGTPLVYEIVGGNIHTDAANVVLSYISDSTDPDVWPPLIQDAVTAELAARIAIPMTGNAALSDSLHKQAGIYMAQESGQQPPRDQDPSTQQREG